MQVEASRIRRTRDGSLRTGSAAHSSGSRSTSSGRLSVATVALALIAAAALSVAAGDGNRGWIIGEIAVQSSLTTAAFGLARRRADRRPPAGLTAGLVAVGLSTLALEPALRVFGVGRAFEIILMDGFRFIALGLAAASWWAAFRRLAVLMSLFVLLFAASISTDRSVQVLVAAYAVVGVAWALAAYWEGLRPRLADTENGGLPKRWLVAAALAVLAVLATGTAGGRDAVRSLSGFMPSSGGDGDGRSDPYARDGVGDGDALVAGSEDVRSFAPIDDAPFLADDKPSLFDVFDDTFEEPYPPPKEIQKAVALTPEELIKKRCEVLAESKQAGREFSTHRKRGRSKEHLADRDSPALLFVAGRTPLHLRMETFDLFDGVTWYPEPTPVTQTPFRATESAGRTWIVPQAVPQGLDVFDGDEAHAIKLVNLKTDRVPAPLHATGFSIEDVPRADFFAWAEESVPRMDRDSIPPLTVIRVASRTVDSGQIATEARGLGGGAERFSLLPEGAAIDRVTALAREWTRDTPRGWPQVEAVTSRLRSDYVLDPAVTAPQGEAFPVGHFLFESRRGPSYQFATASAVLLRSLGYSTRLVGGFYADPADYDRRLRHTPVLAEDAHLWCEICLGAGVWATIEATPGYEVLGPPPGIGERLAAFAKALMRPATEYPIAAALTACLAVTLVRFRREAHDAVASAVWSARRFRSERDAVLAAARIIERRFRNAEGPRPLGKTTTRWLGDMFGRTPGVGGVPVAAFLAAVDWAAFGNGPVPPGALSASRSLVASPTLMGLHRISQASSRPGTLSRTAQRLGRLKVVGGTSG